MSTPPVPAGPSASSILHGIRGLKMRHVAGLAALKSLVAPGYDEETGRRRGFFEDVITSAPKLILGHQILKRVAPGVMGAAEQAGVVQKSAAATAAAAPAATTPAPAKVSAAALVPADVVKGLPTLRIQR